MAKARFTEEQIADFLHQAKNGVPNKVLCEKYEFSISTLRRWQELHAESVRCELKQIESTASMVFLCFFIVAIIAGLAFPDLTGVLIIPPFLLYCVSYIRRFRKISEKHIKEENIFISRSGKAANNVFYNLSWAFIILSIFSLGYITTHLF
ncbi:transposase [Citrobacter sp. NCU1]|uniref:transposase n=1 Tax=Citrobacter sp. NCU1 TaxID=2026683 RepID=UPI001390DC4A|nr:transposase [Citrobacter sp. NCU1]NDO82975.1 transposase [Citrobacter sp. NCU1]